MFFSFFLGDEGNWMWAHSNEFLTDAFWGTNKPNNRTGNSDDCCVMVLKSAVWWEDRSCLVHDISQHAVAPICQHDSIAASTTEVPSTTTTALECSPGWFEFGGHCYLPKLLSVDWQIAEMDCMNYGGHLASIHSKAEDDFLVSLSTSSFWIGGTGTGYPGDWTWSDGSSWDYTHWFLEYSSGNYQCVFYRSGYGWENDFCNDTFYYICKI